MYSRVIAVSCDYSAYACLNAESSPCKNARFNELKTGRLHIYALYKAVSKLKTTAKKMKVVDMGPTHHL